MDTLEQVISETLRDAARSAPAPSSVPANPRPNRRGNVGALLAAAVVLFVLAGGVGLYAFVHRTSDGGGIDRVARPEGDTLVGLGELAMPLPGGWAIGDYRCGEPSTDMVDIQPSGGGIEGCPAIPRPRGVSDVVIDDLGSAMADEWRGVATENVTLDDGTPARIGTVPTPKPAARFMAEALEGYTTTVVVVPGLHAILVGTSPAAEPLDEILLAAGRMPVDRAAVPKLQGLPRAAAAAALEQAGLEAEFERVPYSVRGVIVDSDPGAGLVVPAGSTIRLGVGR
jgi:hypothetical protein